MELTENNHFNFGWGSFSDPTKDQYWIRTGRVRRPILSWREECIKAAEHICQINPEPVLCFGGGIDAEVAFHSLIQTGIHFEVAICEFEYDLNEHDIKWAKQICKDYGIKYHIHKLDIMKFLENDLYDYAEKYKCTSSHAPWHVWLAEQVNGNPIFGGGDLNMFRYESERQMWIKFSPHSTSVARCLGDNKKQGQPYFFLHSPELIYSFLKLPEVEAFAHMALSMKHLSIKWIKPLIYKMSWPEIIYARQKFTGLEKIDEFDQIHRKNLKDMYENHNQPSVQSLDYFIKSLERSN